MHLIGKQHNKKPRSGGAQGLFGFGRELEFGKPGFDEDVVPRKALLDVGNMYPVTVIVGKHLGETGFQLFGGPPWG